MLWQRLFATKSLETLHKEMQEDEGRLRRVLGPIGLTSLGIGAIIGAGIFVMTGRVAAQDAGPAIVVSYCVAGIGCALAAFCYAEFASMAPVAGSAYTYAYATLGELLAWIIGWDLILEYAMSCATVAASWSKYFNAFLSNVVGPNWVVPDRWCHDPFSQANAYMNLPAVCILIVVTTILVIGIRESAAFNTTMVLVKLGVVLFVIAVGAGYVAKSNWIDIPVEARRQPQETAIVGHGTIPGVAEKYVENTEKMAAGAARNDRIELLKKEALAQFRLSRVPIVRAATEKQGHLTPERTKHLDELAAGFQKQLPSVPTDQKAVDAIIAKADAEAPEFAAQKWGILRYLGLNTLLVSIDDSVRSNYFPYGLSGMMLGASLVFFAFIGFDSISTHAEEAVRPQRDVPFGILASLFLCTLLYIAVSAIITGIVPYPEIDEDAAVSTAFAQLAQNEGGNQALRWSAGLIAAGGLAGMTSVLLITFLSQARVFLAMARDRLLPPSVFGVVHPKFKTPHISTMITGAVITVVAAFTPIGVLEEMVNIGTLLAFVIVCGAVLMLRVKRPDAQRPFRCPALFLVAPLGIVVNVIMMLFLPIETWGRLVVWLVIGLFIYFGYGYSRSSLGKRLAGQEG
jgi:APA family basic amino acid/polyamine antiporter